MNHERKLLQATRVNILSESKKQDALHYEKRLLKACYTTILAALTVVVLLVLPGRAGAATLAADQGIRACVHAYHSVTTPAAGTFLDRNYSSLHNPITL